MESIFYISVSLFWSCMGPNSSLSFQDRFQAVLNYLNSTSAPFTSSLIRKQLQCYDSLYFSFSYFHQLRPDMLSNSMYDFTQSYDCIPYSFLKNYLKSQCRASGVPIVYSLGKRCSRSQLSLRWSRSVNSVRLKSKLSSRPIIHFSRNFLMWLVPFWAKCFHTKVQLSTFLSLHSSNTSSTSSTARSFSLPGFFRLLRKVSNPVLKLVGTGGLYCFLLNGSSGGQQAWGGFSLCLDAGNGSNYSMSSHYQRWNVGAEPLYQRVFGSKGVLWMRGGYLRCLLRDQTTI